MAVEEKVLFGSDFHIPYHNKRFVELWFKVMRSFKPDTVALLGDVDDACPVSRFSDGKPIEVENAIITYAPQVQDFLGKIRKARPNARIHYATGNHEARYDEYVAKKAPALKEMITPEFLWKTETHGIELSYYNRPPVKLWEDIDFFIHHGPYALKGAGSSVNKVLDEFGISCMVGHSHRQAFVHKTFELKNEILRGWEIGHMTDVTSEGMAYDRLHDWLPGFAVGYVADGHIHVELVTIAPDYSCIVGGKRYQA